MPIIEKDFAELFEKIKNKGKNYRDLFFDDSSEENVDNSWATWWNSLGRNIGFFFKGIGSALGSNY